MTKYPALKPLGFSILESCLMLVLLTAFSMVAIAVLKKGVTVRQENSSDAEWIKKGGDSTMSTALPLSDGTLLPGSINESPGLGGSAPATQQPKEIPSDQ